VSIFGTDLAASTAQAGSVPLSTSLNDVSVTFNNVPAPLQLVSTGQINAQIPWDAASGQATAVVTRAGARSNAVQFPVVASAPGIFSVQFGVGQAIAINSDGTLAAPPGSIPGLTTHPARVADQGGVILYVTGLGAVDSPIANGANSLDKLRNTVAKPAVTIGGMPVQVVFSGLTPQFPGVNQVNIFIPPGTPTGDKLPIQIQSGGITSTDQVTIAVAP
jgi:uncharacterized protein (TIGR03437 family)